MADLYAKHLMCRGKTRFGWAEGYFLPYRPEDEEADPVILVYKDEVCSYFTVDPDTVTSCSGLPSKTGKLIYDQDIVIDRAQKLAGIVEYSEEDGTYAVVTKDGKIHGFGEIDSTELYIVGNAFDNPDYLDFV